jgi:hypothetical protein
MYRVSDFIDVKKKAREIGCNIPSHMALLPRNFETALYKEELIHEITTPTVRALWRQNGINETPIEKPEEKIPFIDEMAFEWVGPIIFVSAMLLSHDPHLVTIALNVISNYLMQWFKGIPRDSRKAKLTIIVETKSSVYKKIEYEGPVDGLENLAEVIRGVHNE